MGVYLTRSPSGLEKGGFKTSSRTNLPPHYKALKRCHSIITGVHFFTQQLNKGASHGTEIPEEEWGFVWRASRHTNPHFHTRMSHANGIGIHSLNNGDALYKKVALS